MTIPELGKLLFLVAQSHRMAHEVSTGFLQSLCKDTDDRKRLVDVTIEFCEMYSQHVVKAGYLSPQYESLANKFLLQLVVDEMELEVGTW